MKPSRPPKPVTAVISRTIALPRPISTATDSTRTGPYRLTKIGLSWVIRISPTALALKARPNCCGDRPNMPCRMNGAPEM